MTARVVDLAQHSRNKPSPNGHKPPPRPPSIPTLSIDFVAGASQRCQANEIPATAEGRVYVEILPDNTFTVKVARMGEKHSLILQGTEASSAPVIMREIICWLFGVPV
jgi:hypothetical protein